MVVSMKKKKKKLKQNQQCLISQWKHSKLEIFHILGQWFTLNLLDKLNEVSCVFQKDYNSFIIHEPPV